jgi:hypothetical protein
MGGVMNKTFNAKYSDAMAVFEKAKIKLNNVIEGTSKEIDKNSVLIGELSNDNTLLKEVRKKASNSLAKIDDILN